MILAKWMSLYVYTIKIDASTKAYITVNRKTSMFAHNTGYKDASICAYSTGSMENSAYVVILAIEALIILAYSTVSIAASLHTYNTIKSCFSLTYNTC
jgi:hypothetical protein